MKILSVILFLYSLSIFGQIMEPDEGEITRSIPKSEDPKTSNFYKGLLDEKSVQMQVLQERLQQLERQKVSGDSQPNTTILNSNIFNKSNDEGIKTKPYVNKSPNRKAQPSYGTGFSVLTVTDSWNSSFEGLSGVPGGSWVKATMLTGMTVGPSKSYEALLQLDYALTGPNGFKIPLNGCTMTVSGVADLNIERVALIPVNIFCVRENGQKIKRPVKGFVAGKDSSNGVEGVYSSKQDKVFLWAILGGIVKGLSEGYQLKQITQSAASGLGSGVAKNLTGDPLTYGAAKGTGNAAEMVTDWYLKQAMALFPTISLGSGDPVWVVLTDDIENVPSLTMEEF